MSATVLNTQALTPCFSSADAVCHDEGHRRDEPRNGGEKGAGAERHDYALLRCSRSAHRLLPAKLRLRPAASLLRAHSVLWPILPVYCCFVRLFSTCVQTQGLEASIGKICSLLAIGFGDAGAEIIGENMKNGGELNPMVPGRKVNAIFGFCDIRQFTETTEVLQEQVC